MQCRMFRWLVVIVFVAITYLLQPLQHGAVAQTFRENAASWFSTPFGIVYKIHSRDSVDYPTKYSVGTIIVSTSQRYLYYITEPGKAIRYTIGVGREGYGWTGVSTVSAKREWPDWSPTPSFKKEHPETPAHMKGGPDNPLGSRALYLGATLYRIHGTNEPWKIGDAVSSGCIRLTNDDIEDLYDRAKVGATVVVQK